MKKILLQPRQNILRFKISYWKFYLGLRLIYKLANWLLSNLSPPFKISLWINIRVYKKARRSWIRIISLTCLYNVWWVSFRIFFVTIQPQICLINARRGNKIFNWFFKWASKLPFIELQIESELCKNTPKMLGPCILNADDIWLKAHTCTLDAIRQRDATFQFLKVIKPCQKVNF